MRTVKYNFDRDSLETLTNGVGPINLQSALQYLAFWAWNGFDTVEICSNSDFSLIASYSDSAGVEGRYVIAGVWDATDKRYSFHS